MYVSLYLLYDRKYERFLWILPFWTYIGTSFLGPAALLRYGYPVMLGAPLLLFFLPESVWFLWKEQLQRMRKDEEG